MAQRPRYKPVTQENVTMIFRLEEASWNQHWVAFDMERRFLDHPPRQPLEFGGHFLEAASPSLCSGESKVLLEDIDRTDVFRGDVRSGCNFMTTNILKKGLRFQPRRNDVRT